jgi:hypothetical protein
MSEKLKSDRNRMFAYLAVLCMKNGGKVTIPDSILANLDFTKGELTFEYDMEEMCTVVKYKQTL